MAFHISRWRYWWAYLVVFALALFTIYLKDRAADAASWIVGIIALILFIIMEVVIRKEKVSIADDIAIMRGKSVTHISFNQISDVSVSQSVLQNLLRYGTVSLKTPGEEIVLSSFAEANKIKKQIESKMHSVHEKHAHHAQKPHVGP